jgi:Xaa-Pro aminopeptidase
MILMDAGCQYRDYASDITRTWPCGGKFKNAQKDLYEACLNVQKFCIANLTPGLSIQQLYFIMMRKMSEELSSLGIIDQKDHDTAIKPTDSITDSLPMGHLQKLTKFCPHDVGHYLGLDVHDCPEISKHASLEPGCVITIEPGIYIKPNDEAVPSKYRGIGIRIEDNVVLTDDGYEILSKKCPKEIDAIEKLTYK